MTEEWTQQALPTVTGYGARLLKGVAQQTFEGHRERHSFFAPVQLGLPYRCLLARLHPAKPSPARPSRVRAKPTGEAFLDD